MDCVAFAQQIADGQQTLGVSPPPTPPAWMRGMMRWVKSQPLLMRAGLPISGARILAQTYHPKAIGASKFPISLVYHSKAIGAPKFPTSQAYHPKVVGKPASVISRARIVKQVYHAGIGGIPIRL